MHNNEISNHAPHYNVKQFYQRVFVLAFLLFSTGFFMKATAQRDILMTQAGEQIRCRILNETPTRFVYVYMRADGKILQSEIFKSLIKEFKYGYYPNDILDATGKPMKLPTKEVFTKTPKVTKKEELEKAQEMEKKILESQRQMNNQVPANQPRRQSPPRPSVEYQETQNELEKNSSKKTDEKAIKEKKNEANVLENDRKKKENRQKEIAEETAEKVKKQEQLKANAIKRAAADTNLYKSFLQYRVGVRGGIANVLKQLVGTDEYSNYQKELQKGWFLGIDAAIFPFKNIGLGLIYTNFQAKNANNSIRYTSVLDASQPVLGKVSDKVSSKFWGATLLLRSIITRRTSVILGLSPGMNFYSNGRTENYNMISVKGHEMGGAATLGVDYTLGSKKNRDILLSLEGGYNYAKYNKLDYGNGEKSLAIPLDMSHWNITLGLHFTRFPKSLRAIYN